jgi:hypothetical protein
VRSQLVKRNKARYLVDIIEAEVRACKIVLGISPAER